MNTWFQVLQRRQEKFAKEEADRIEVLRAAELENRRDRAAANIAGRAACGRPQNAMGMSELADALKDADGGGTRYESQPKRVSKASRTPSSESGRRDDDTDSDEDAIWDRDSDVGSVISDSAGLDEDMQRREEELREELKIATVRCSQLKATLKETKSFFQAPSIAIKADMGGVEGEEEEEEDDVYESDAEELEESWTAQGMEAGDVRDTRGRQLFEGKAADEGDGVDLDSTAPRLQTRGAAAIIPPYRNLKDAPSPSGRLSDRIERLRQRCIEALGHGAFDDSYTYLKNHENDDRGFYEDDVEQEKQRRVRAILGEGKAHFMPLIEQLIFMEETHSS